MYPSSKEFRNLLRTQSMDSILNDHLLTTALPFSFSTQPAIYCRLIGHLAQGLQVPETDICIVGSARIGFSLSPYKYGTPFNRYSDIDIVVVSQDIFDMYWLDILTRRRKPWQTLRAATRTQLRAHQHKHFIYNGWIYPRSLYESLSDGYRWMSTFNSISRIPELASRTINSRLYRTWDHVRHYHRRSLRQLARHIDSP